MTKQDALKWMDKQIIACNIQNTPLDPENPFFVNNAAGWKGNSVHVYRIDELCKLLSMKYDVEPNDVENDIHYFIYKGYKFYGLVEKNKMEV